VGEFIRAMNAGDQLKEQRALQAKAWMWKEIHGLLLNRFSQHKLVAEQLMQVERDVYKGKKSATAAALELVTLFQK
jgi:hypothetical protein